MKRTIAWKTAVVISVILLPTLVFASKQSDDVQKAKVMKKAYRMRIPFIENRGQIENNNVGFYAKTFGGTLYVEKDGTLTYSFPGENNTGVVIKELITDKKVKVKGLDPSPTRINYFKGKDQSKWKTNIPSYNSVSLGEIYKGVNLELKAYGNNVEKLFTVSPGENPEVIKIKLNGAKGLKVNEKGELEVITELGPVKFTKPLAYQEIDGKRVEVNVSYNIQGLGFRGQETHFGSRISDWGLKNRQNIGAKRQNPESEFQNPKSEVLQSEIRNPKSEIKSPSTLAYSFKVGNYDKNRPLVIDPLLASTFIGGWDSDEAHCLVLDESGNVYVAGQTNYSMSENFPTTPGAYDTSHNLIADGFISKLDSDLSTLLASTFIGGSGYESIEAIAIDGSGNVYITGHLASTDYPTTEGAYDRSYDALNDSFVSKLDNTLSTLLASTYLGGANIDYAYSLALDDSGNVYVAGYAQDGFPTIPGAYDQFYNGGTYDVFVSKLDTNLTSLLNSTYIGGTGMDRGTCITLDEEGYVYITGGATTDYPTTPGAYNESSGGSFVSILNNNLSSLSASTFIGSGWGRSLALDGSGHVYVTGNAGSGFPTTPGAYDESHNGDTDVFVSKFDSTLSTLLASTFIGGTFDDWSLPLTLDGCGNVYIAGFTDSSDYPSTQGAYDGSFNGGPYDVVVSKLSSNLNYLFTSTFIGGYNYDAISSLAIDENGDIYLAGYTNSSDFPTTSGAYDQSLNGNHTAVFVSKLDSDLSADSGFLSATSSFLFDPFAVSLKLDVDQDGIFDIPCTELLLCEGQVVEMDVWLANWNGAWGNIDSIAYDFSLNTDKLQIESITCDPQWDDYCIETPQGSDSYHLEVGSSSGIPGPDIKLHTVKIKCVTIDAPLDVIITISDTSVTPTPPDTVEDGELKINAICGAEPLECNEEDHCEMLSSNDICPDTANPDSDNGYELLEEGTTFCEGEMINVIHTSLGSYTAYIVGQIDNMCSSVCFNECFNDCAYVEQQGCYLNCVKGCTNGVCPDWDEPEVCNEYQNRIDCNIACYNDCYYSYDGETHTSHYDKRCGFPVHEIITVKVDAGNDCEGSSVGKYELTGAGTAAISIPLPLAAGSYDICAGTTLIETVTVQNCGEPVCTLSIPTNSFLADRGIDNSLSVTLSNLDAGGNYSLSLKRWEDDEHTIPMDIPASLNVPAQRSVAEDGSIAFDLDTTNPQDVDGQSHWANIIIWAEGLSTSCGASFDFDIRNISARADCGPDDYFSVSETVYGRAFLGLDTGGNPYPLYVVEDTSWTDGMTIPSRVSGSEESFTTNGSGDMACGTVIWSNVQADPLPAQFDIVIDVNSNGLFNEGTDYLDGKTGAGFGIYTDTDDDGVPDIEDNCWEVSNPYQLDSDGDCPDPPYTSDPQCGDICEPDNQCQADFDNDGNVYPSDLSVFLGEYGRTDCLTNPPCQADFDDDGNVYPSDLSVFLAGYGRTDCLE